MRLNRNIRIGAAIVALCLLLLGLLKIIGSLRGTTQPTSVASNAGAGAGPAPAPTAALVSATMVAKARADIPERSIVTPEMLAMVPASPGADSTAFVTNLQEQAVGYITARPIVAGATVRRADLLGHISDVGIAGALLPGRRAMIIPISNKATLHELVRIGDRVDVMASFDQQESRVVAEDVRVLAVDVFGNDYPQVKIAMRGDYKAPARSLSTAVPSSAIAPGQPAGAPANPDAPPGQQPAADATATPEPTAANGPPPARPEASLTIEVTPQQATDIGLTQSAGQNLDFLLRARSEPRLATTAIGADGLTLASGTTGAGTTRSAAFSTRERIAPYSARLKRAGAASATRNSPTRQASATRRRPSTDSDLPTSNYKPPVIPDANSNSGGVPPANLGGATRIAAPPPTTYDIPVYGDGKLVRTDTVRRPQQ